ncbi:putative nuclease HARBI1 [Megalops cyprinoides]|uniref:putative nuclease HARBI1 n=1 Tax=Megalops cyprinoides TaxID=118141 RepID=UPI0018644183|nr:putative nuclease HARBI1 [Megalops cyprinoides]
MSYAAAVWFAAQEEVEKEERVNIPRLSFDDFDDDFIFKHFHFTRPAINFIIDYTRAHLNHPPSVHSVDAMVLAALCLYANGSLTKEIADMIGLSEVAISRAVHIVSALLSDKAEDFITFPNGYNDRVLLAQEIQRFCGMPNVVGVLGCMHVRIKPPPGEEIRYLNFMGHYSTMFQMICDSQGNLLSVENQWPGSTSEQNVWESSKICQQFKSGRHGHSWLIGASSYSLDKHVLTPLSYVRERTSIRYNEAHFKIGSAIQKTFCALKTRFRCLDNLGNIQKYTYNKPAEIVNACCVLHNIAMKFSIALPGKLVPEPVYHGINRQELTQGGSDMLLFREEMIKAFFSQDSDNVLGFPSSFEMA